MVTAGNKGNRKKKKAGSGGAAQSKATSTATPEKTKSSPMRSSRRRSAASASKSYSEREADAEFEASLIASSGSGSGSGSDEEDGDGTKTNNNRGKKNAGGAGTGKTARRRRGSGNSGGSSSRRGQGKKTSKAKTNTDVGSGDDEEEKKDEDVNDAAAEASKGGRKKRKRAAKVKVKAKAKAEEKDVEEEDEEDEEDEQPTKKKKKTKKKPTKGSEGSGPFVCQRCKKSFKGQNGLDYHVKMKVCHGANGEVVKQSRRWDGKGGKYGPVEMRTCPHCHKVFSIISGLAYHLENRVCQRAAEAEAAGVVVSRAGTGKVSGGGGSTKDKVKKGTHRATTSRIRVPVEVRNIAGRAPYPQLEAGQRFVTQYGVVEVVADDRIPEDYGTTKVGGFDLIEDGLDAEKLKTLGKEVVLYKRHEAKDAKFAQDLWGTFVRANIRHRRKLGQHYAKEAGLVPPGDIRSSAGTPMGGQPTSQMIVWRERVTNPLLTPASILHNGASYSQCDKNTSKGGGAAKSPNGIVTSQKERNPDPLVPADSYPDRIVTCVLIKDQRKRIFDPKEKVGPIDKSSNNIDIILKAQAEAKKAKEEKKKKANRKVSQIGKDSSKSDDDLKEKSSEDDGPSPIISKLFLRRRLLKTPYDPSSILYICPHCARQYSSRESLRDHISTRACLPPDTDSESDEDEESAPVAAPKVLEGSGIKLRSRHAKKRKAAYVDVDSDDDGGAAGEDDEEWDAANAEAQKEDDDDESISVVPEKDDEKAPVELDEEDDADMLIVDAVPPRSSRKSPRKKRKRSSVASVVSTKSRNGLGLSTKLSREAALEDFDSDGSNSSVDATPRRKRPSSVIKKEVGRRLSRKEWKLLRRPGWMVFKPDESCWYPEIMKTLGIKRGSNNSNWRRIKTNKKRFTPVKNVRQERRKKVKLGNAPVYPDVYSRLNVWGGLASICLYPNAFESLGFKKGKQQAKRIRLQRQRSCPALDICGDEDRNYERRDQRLARLEREAAEGTTERTKSKKRKRKRTERRAPVREAKIDQDTCTDPSSRDFTVNAFKVRNGPMIDLNVLIEEVDAGRYPSMKRYHEDHLDVCEICLEADDDEEESSRGPIYGCAFCSNAEHLSCLLSKYNIHDFDEDDDFICHSCLASCLHRRNRAEKRRLAKTGGFEDELDQAQGTSRKASGLPQEDHNEDGDFVCMDVDDGDYDLDMPPLGGPEAATTAAGTPASASTTISTTDNREIRLSGKRAASGTCPNGGPGGLVCCQQCATSYSRILSNTTKEMETQTVAKVGKEVGELMELLRDAQTRLRLAVDVSKENDIRRRTIDE